MSEQPKCDGTSSSSIPNTLLANQIPLQGESGKSGKKKQKRQHAIENAEGELLTRFHPLDMRSLTFKPIGSEQEVSIWLATAQEFHAYVSQYVNSFRNVNTDIWSLSDRLTLINVLWDFCEARGHPFPFTIQQHLVPDVAGNAVPDVDGNADTSAYQAV